MCIDIKPKKKEEKWLRLYVMQMKKYGWKKKIVINMKKSKGRKSWVAIKKKLLVFWNGGKLESNKNSCISANRNSPKILLCNDD